MDFLNYRISILLLLVKKVRSDGKSVCVCVLVSQSHPALCNPTDCSWPGSSVHGILQTRVLERFAIPFSRWPSWPRDWTCVSCSAGSFFTIRAINLSEPQGMSLCSKVHRKRTNFFPYLLHSIRTSGALLTTYSKL